MNQSVCSIYIWGIFFFYETHVSLHIFNVLLSIMPILDELTMLSTCSLIFLEQLSCWVKYCYFIVFFIYFNVVSFNEKNISI